MQMVLYFDQVWTMCW